MKIKDKRLVNVKLEYGSENDAITIGGKTFTGGIDADYQLIPCGKQHVSGENAIFVVVNGVTMFDDYDGYTGTKELDVIVCDGMKIGNRY